VAASRNVKQQTMLSERWPLDLLRPALLPRAQWKPFPTASDRAGWMTLSEELRTELTKGGEEKLGAPWPELPATLFLEYKRTGNRSRYEALRNARRDRLRQLAITECAEGKGRFLDDIANGVWTTCEETFWGVPAHLGAQKLGTGLPDVTEPVVDLFAAETGSLLAWIAYLLGPQMDQVHSLVRRRIEWEVNRRILTPCLDRDDFAWMGLRSSRPVNNWNPWINSNWLTCNLLLESDGDRRLKATGKILRSLDRFLAGYAPDGGCDEGPGYWGRAGASLFDCLELLHSASGGKIDFYSEPLVAEIGRYIYRAHIAGDFYTNFADASARLSIAADLVYRYGRRIGDAKMQALGAWAAAKQARPGLSDSIGRQLPALFNEAELSKAKGYPPLVRDTWMPGIQVMAARVKEGSAQGFYLAAQGGHNAESHNHNDVGNFMVFADGEPLIIDVGVETYSAKTFSAQRYEIWTMQSAYHNLPTIGGVMQGAGREYEATEVAYQADDGAAQVKLNIAAAYPKEAGLDYWRRTLRLDRAADRVEIHDEYALNKPAPDITLTLMSAAKPEPAGAGELILRGEKFRSPAVKLSFDGGVFRPRVETIEVTDARLLSSWGGRLYRILLAAERPPLRAAWKLLLSK
jgi:hypothetical protein